jgi:PAS domain-containing protein
VRGCPIPPHATRPTVITIPSSDGAFRTHVQQLAADESFEDAEAFEARLRRLYPRVRVRARELSAELPTWYVYRDGAWQPARDEAWWTDPRLGSMELDTEGRLLDANPTARSLLAIGDNPREHRYTDFLAPGTVADATALYEIVAVRGETVDATVRIRPTTGDVIPVELHAWRDGERVRVVVRLADDVEVEAPAAPRQPTLEAEPVQDGLFAAYAEQLLARMPEPTPEGLALRLRRLYPHADVEDRGDRWVVRRGRDDDAQPQRAEWWLDPALATVDYDSDGLIVRANDAATALLGPSLVGRHWQELVTPGSNDQVGPIIDLIRQAGSAVSRFRMPAHDGSLVEFDSYTSANGEMLRTVMRPT